MICTDTISVFYGTSNRRQSEKYGCWVWLCGKHHNLSDFGIHSDKELDLKVKKLAQSKFEENHSRQQFMEIFGKSWI